MVIAEENKITIVKNAIANSSIDIQREDIQ